MAYRRQNPIHQRLQRAFFVPLVPRLVRVNEPGGQREGARLQGRPGAKDSSKAARAGPRDRLPGPRREHCPPSLQAGVLSWGAPEEPPGATQSEGPPGLGVSLPPPPRPPKWSPGRGGGRARCANQGPAKMRLDQCARAGGPSRHVQEPCRRPTLREPRPRPPARD